MTRYQVPQFLEIEDKIFGPLTLKQFLYVAGGASLAFIIWTIIPVKFIAVIVAMPVIAFFLALAFYKVNNRPFSYVIENAFRYFFKNKLYLWKKNTGDSANVINENIVKNEDTEYAPVVPKLANSRLKDMAWSLDVNKNVGGHKRENEELNKIIRSGV